MEIERKFLIKEMPDISNKEKISYERYFLKITPEYEERIQRKGERYEHEKKRKISPLSRETKKENISKELFDSLKKKAIATIQRESYLISQNPEITLKVYRGTYEGLIRVEVEFSSEEEAKKYQKPSWMGKEITETDLGNDAKLITLDKDTFLTLLKKLS